MVEDGTRTLVWGSELQRLPLRVPTSVRGLFVMLCDDFGKSWISPKFEEVECYAQGLRQIARDVMQHLKQEIDVMD